MNGEEPVPLPALDGSHVTPQIGSDLFPRIQPLSHGFTLPLGGYEEPIRLCALSAQSLTEVF